jgi:gluconate 5-dehydrogenase
MIEKLFDLSGRRALVTGSSRGIGKSIAAFLANAGAEVIIHGSSDSPRLHETAAEIAQNSAKIETLTANLANPQEVDSMIENCGKVDILVLNASVQAYMNFENFDQEEAEREYQVNLMSGLKLIQAFLPDMKEQKWGRILAIGSVNQNRPSPRLSVYSSTKAALSNLIMNCAKQYAPYGITANILAPGVILTDRNSEALSDQDYCAQIMKIVPAGRFASPDDCAGISLLLCSEAGNYITGADIPVDGGMHL